jgi:hypothetical protein
MNALIRREENGFDTIQTTRPVGFPLACPKGHWKYDGGDPQPGERFVVLMPSWLDGEIFWQDNKAKEIKTNLVVEQGLWGRPEEGRNKYSCDGRKQVGVPWDFHQ